MFKLKPIHIRLSRNRVEITNLESGEVVTRSAVEPFSSDRNVVGRFKPAEETIEAALTELGVKRGIFGRELIVAIQQMEGTEGGLSDIEKRALRDLAEQVGGKKVYVIEDEIGRRVEEVLGILKLPAP